MSAGKITTTTSPKGSGDRRIDKQGGGVRFTIQHNDPIGPIHEKSSLYLNWAGVEIF